MKKEDMQSMQTWIGVIQSLAFWMEEAGIEVADQDKILMLTMGLPNTYDAVIINFDLTPANLFTLNHIITQLLNEETRQVSQAPVTNDHCDTNEAMATMRSPLGHRTRPAPSTLDVTCYFRNKKGHYKSDCLQRKEWATMKAKKAGVATFTVGYDSDNSDKAF
ncbi:hypothetical protein L208DRAFT_1382541 [Tricholoma matsutake]|nr:hypothetical protein L208DRAFT_1382541 [Tricholoma matsutake 945]